jgi:hypothetical protein
LRELPGNICELDEGKGLERLTLKIRVGACLAQQITSIGNLDEDDLWSRRRQGSTQAPFGKAICIGQKGLLGQYR